MIRPISYSCSHRYNYRSYLSIYTTLVKRNPGVTMVIPMVERLRNWPIIFLFVQKLQLLMGYSTSICCFKLLNFWIFYEVPQKSVKFFEFLIGYSIQICHFSRKYMQSLIKSKHLQNTVFKCWKFTFFWFAYGCLITFFVNKHVGFLRKS